MLELGIKITLAYALGSVLGGMLVGRVRGHVDLRTVGSGNVGGTNALRTQGKWFALCVMVIDVGKGIFAAAVLPDLRLPGIGIDPEVDRALVTYAVSYAAIVGHVFPIWHEFRGGKGGATAAGLLIYLAPDVAVPVLVTWLAIVFFAGYVGIATVSAAVLAPVWVGVTAFAERNGFFVFSSLVAILIIYTHRGNLRRMLAGTEARFGRFFGLR